MSDTINGMELIKADVLPADAIEIGDLISYDDEIVEVISIEVDSTGDVYSIEVSNDFGVAIFTEMDLLLVAIFIFSFL